MAKGFIHESSHNESKEWYTPPQIFEALGLTFDMDVASPGHDAVPWIPAILHLTIFENGLTSAWHGMVWCNPPYGTDTPAWIARMSEHAHGIMLVFARCDTEWFHKHAVTADLVCFVHGRIAFKRPSCYVAPEGKVDGGPGAGSMLLAWGEDCANALRKSMLGVCMTLDVRKAKQKDLFSFTPSSA